MKGTEKMKKTLAIILALIMVFSTVGCAAKTEAPAPTEAVAVVEEPAPTEEPVVEEEPVPAEEPAVAEEFVALVKAWHASNSPFRDPR